MREIRAKLERRGEFDPAGFVVLRDIVSRLGLADVRAFGLQWEDCEEFLSRLGYRVRLEVSDRIPASG